MWDSHHKVVITCLFRLLKNYNYAVRALVIFQLPCKRVFVNLDGINCKELASHEVTNWIGYIAGRVEPSRVIYTAGYDPMCYYLLLVGSGESSMAVILAYNMNAQICIHTHTAHTHTHTAHTHTHTAHTHTAYIHTHTHCTHTHCIHTHTAHTHTLHTLMH